MRISDWSSDVCSSDLGSFRGLRKIDAMDQLFRAALHRRGRAADGVGEVEILDRRRDRACLGLRGQLGNRPAIVGDPFDAERRHRGDHRRTALRKAVEADRSEEHTSELQSLMRISYAVFCLKKKKKN